MASGASPPVIPGTLVPRPPAKLSTLVSTMTWPAGQVVHRIHPDVYAADQFNPGPHGNARFSPIKDVANAQIPTIYGGTTFDCAAMETVFHDVPFTTGLKTVDKFKLVDKLHSQVVPSRALTLIDLRSTALRRLGVRRNELIDTEKDQYPGTRAWAEAIHAACPTVDGLCWTSRQDDSALAIMLFGQRVRSTDLQAGASVNIVSDGPTYSNLLNLAERIGVRIVSPF